MITAAATANITTTTTTSHRGSGNPAAIRLYYSLGSLGLPYAGPAAARADAAAEDGQGDEAADDAGDGDDDVEVALDPVDAAADPAGAGADAVLAGAAAVAGRAVEEVLLHVVAVLGAQLRRRARHDAAAGLRGASRRVVARGQRAHEGLALLVAGGALARGAREPGAAVAAGRAVVRLGVLGARGGIARARLLGVAAAGAGAAHGPLRGELALVGAAVLVGRVADRVVLVLARGGVAAVVVAAALLPAAVALLVLLDDAVAALAASDRVDAPVVAQTRGADAVAAHGRADVPDAAGREGRNSCPGGGVHDEFPVSITGGRGERAALLHVYRTVGARRLRTIVECAEGVTRLVSKDLPLRTSVRSHDNVGPRDSLVASGSITLA